MSTILLTDWLAQRLDRDSRVPMYRQLYDGLLQAVLQSRLVAGTRLPSSRLLAAELGVARNTVLEVYEHLRAEGCLVSRHGSGTFVADLSVERMVGAGAPHAAAPQAPAAARAIARLSRRGAALVDGARAAPRQWGAFMPGVPDVTEFPARLWMTLHNRHWRSAPAARLSYAPGGGLPALREALAEHLRSSRSVQCEADQIVITTGIHQSIDLAARLLADPGDHVWLEDPCYWGLRSTLQTLGLKLHPVKVDREGLNWNDRKARPTPRLVLVTPSHHYPLGMVMSLARRQALLDHCQRHGSWVIEDDYDSEFRYGTRPIASLQGLDGAQRVIYIGSFSKTLFPGLRVGYAVVPPALAEPFAKASAELYREGQLQQQAMLADFIAQGHLASHIRRMRALYGQRRQRLLEAIRKHVGDELSVAGDDAGLHLVLRLPDAVDDLAVTADAYEAGILVRPLSRYYAAPRSGTRGLLLGYACVPEQAIDPAFAVLASVLRKHLRPAPRRRP